MPPAFEAPRHEAPVATRPPDLARPAPAPNVPAGATSLSRVTEPSPEVRVINVRKPPEAVPAPAEERAEERLFAEEGSAEGCASGDCLPEASAESKPEPEPKAAPAGNGRDTPTLPIAERWRAAVESVRTQSPRHGTALAHGRLLWLRPGEVGLAYATTAAFHRGMLTGGSGKLLVEKALSEHFGRPMKLVAQEATGEAAEAAAAPLSIAEQDAQARTAHTQSTEGKVRTHPAVRAVLKILGGEIEHIQVLEPERPSASPTIESPDESA